MDQTNSNRNNSPAYATDSDIPLLRKTRFFVIMMLFLGIANAYVFRTNMSVAIVAMVNHTALAKDHKDNDNDDDNDKDNSNSHGEFDWSYKLQGYILASFFYGYVVTQIPFGFLIKSYGAKYFLGYGMLINSLASFLVPEAARRGGYIALCIIRFIQGLGEGPIVPCTHSMLAQWVPANERSRCGAIVYAGAQFGTIVSMPLSGFLAAHGFDGGWPSIFYIFGIVSTLWCIAFLCTVPETPEVSKNIHETERKHILQSIWTQPPADGTEKTPVLQIITSLPFLAILLAHIAQNYGYETLMTELPTYLSTTMHLNIKTNGLLSALPYLAMWLMAMLFAVLADALISHNVSITTTRKLLNSVGQYGPAIMLFLVGYMHESLMLTMLLFTLGLGLNGAIYSGFKINHLDISPTYAGLLISITNCSANLVGLLAPMVAGHVINDNPDINSWRLVFLISTVVYTLCATFYLIFASGKRQW